MLRRFILLLSAGVIVACIVAFIWGIIGPFIPGEYMWTVIWVLIIIGAIAIVVLLNR